MAFAVATLITLTAVLGSTGVLPEGGTPAHADDGAEALSLAGQGSAATSNARQPSHGSEGVPSDEPSAGRALDPVRAGAPEAGLPVPADSGTGRRVVFDMSDQRVWLVTRKESVRRSYLVSGSVYDNLEPGRYAVYSRSKQAYAYDGSGSMRLMVRFAHGANAAIGFHDIPVSKGKRVQSRALLGTPQSHGCIRQWPDDARALWDFAPLGTAVVVTA